MKRPIFSLICLASVLNAGAVAMRAQAPAADSTAPSYDLKAQALLDLEAVNKKCVDLATALPNEKLSRTRGRLLKCFCTWLESATQFSA